METRWEKKVKWKNEEENKEHTRTSKVKRKILDSGRQGAGIKGMLKTTILFSFFFFYSTEGQVSLILTLMDVLSSCCTF